MAVSMKDLDPAFQGISQQSGMEVWRIEKSRPVAVPRSHHYKFFPERSYLILKTIALKSGAFRHRIHYWLGRRTRQGDAAAAAVKAVELDAALGGRAVQIREVEGYETDMFLSYFKPCFIPEDGVSSDTDKATVAVHQTRLFMCTGRHVARVKMVPFTRSSLSHNNVFILDTESKIFQFNGANTDTHQRARALDVVQYLKENFHEKECHVAVIEDGKFVADADSGEFWGLFGGYAPLGKKPNVKDDFEGECTAGTLYCIIEGQAKMKQSGLKRECLTSNNCYIVDCGREVLTWLGHNSTLEERKATLSVVEELISNRKKRHQIRLTWSIEGFEPREFKLKFQSWPVSSELPVSEDGRGKVAVLLQQKGFNVKGLLKAAPFKEHSPLFNSAGKLEVWRVNGSSKEGVYSSDIGKLYNNNCYIVLYTYPGEQKEECLVCLWLGHNSTMDTQASAAQYANEIAGSLRENTVELRIFEGKEPTQFLSIFDELFIMQGDEHDKGIHLFEVHQSGPLNWHATQVPLVATSLNSSGCFILQTENDLFTWYGKFSGQEEQDATENMVHCLQQGASTISLKEGSESEAFWEVLGGKRVHPSHQEPKESAKDPHLFSCTYEKGQFKFIEVFNVTQEHLLSDEVMIVDCHTDVFVWVGQSVSIKHKAKALEIGQKYLEEAAAYEGLSLETPLYKIIEGSEPFFFTALFSWDSSKIADHLNSFQRKLLSLKEQSLQATEGTRSKRRSPRLDGIKEGFALTDKPLLGRSATFTVERIQTPRGKLGNSRSLGRSTSVSAMTSMYQLQNGGGLFPNTPTVKLAPLKTREALKESPSAAPSTTTPRTPRPASPRSPVIAALASVFEPYSDRRHDFAWPGVKSKSEEKPATREIDAETPKTKVEKRQEILAGETIFLYERLKLSSPNPIEGIDKTKREAYLSNEEFQETFHMDRDTFYKLPKWKQDKYKILADLF